MKQNNRNSKKQAKNTVQSQHNTNSLKNQSEIKPLYNERDRMRFDAMITEYNSMKTESMAKLQFQITLISLYITALGTIASIALNNSDTSQTFLDFKNLFCFIIPCVTICFTVIWLDQVYRQIKIAHYLSLLETKINRFLGFEKNEYTKSPMIWEHWLRTSRLNTWKLNASQTFYCVCLGIFFVVPILSYFYGLVLIDFSIKSISIQTTIVILGYLICSVFAVIYIVNILKLNKAIQDDTDEDEEEKQ